MTPAEKLILRVLAEEFERDPDEPHPLMYGPYGRTMERTGVEAHRAATIEEKYAAWGRVYPGNRTQAKRIRAIL